MGEKQTGESASAGMAWNDIAASAYRAYAASTGNKNFRGEPMPAFEDLPVAIQTAWEAAARHVGNLTRFPIDDLSAMEESWTGWTPPQ